MSFDGGVTWATIEGSQRIPVVSSFFFDSLLNRVVVSSYGRGLWKLPRTDGIEYTVAGVPDSVPITVVNETTGARTTLRPDADGGHRGIELTALSNVGAISYHFEVGGVATPSISHTVTAAERSAGFAAVTDTIVHHSQHLTAPPAATPGVGQTLTATYESTFGGNSITDPTITFTLPGSSTTFRATWSLDFDTLCISPPPAAGAACGQPNFGAAISNNFFTLDIDHTTTTTSGNVRTVNWAVTFKDAAASHLYNVTTSASDASGAGLPWDPVTTPMGITHPPTAGPFSAPATFVAPNADITVTASYSDPDGTADLASALLTLTGGAGLSFTVANHTMRASDQPLLTLGCVVGQPGSVVTTPTVRIDCGASSFSTAGTTLTVNWRVRFAAPLSGRRYPVSLQASDVARGTSGPVAAGFFAVDQPPAFSGFSPTSGSQPPENGQIFSANFTDPDLGTNLATGTLRLAASTGLRTSQSVELYWFEATNTIGIGNNLGKAIAVCSPGSPAVDTPLATLNCNTSSTTALKNGSAQIVGRIVNWNVVPHAAMSGLTYTSTLSVDDDAQVNVGPTTVGSYTVNRDPNSGVNSPATGTSTPGEMVLFTTTCSDPDGWHRLQTIDLRLSKGNGQGPLALWVQLDEETLTLRMYDPDTGKWSVGSPGTDTVLSTRLAELQLAQASVTGSGPTGPSVQITWAIVLRDPAARANWQQQLRITDDTGATTGLDDVGRWTIH